MPSQITNYYNKDGKENCAYISTINAGGEWNDNDCKMKMAYICQRDKTGTRY